MDITEKTHLTYEKGKDTFLLSVPYSLREQVKRIGGKWEQSGRAWRFPVDISIWEEIRRTFGGKGDLLVQRAFLDRIEELKGEQKDLEEMKRLADEDNPTDFSVQGISLNGENPFFNYQKWGVKCALQAGSGFLFGDVPGLGKSVQALGVAIERRNRKEISSCLIVCLASLKYNWLDEIKKFTKENALVVDGPPEERHKKWLAGGYFFKIANYETIVNDLFLDVSPHSRSRKTYTKEETDFRKFMQKQFEMVIVDEIHAIKHHHSQRTQAMKQLQSKYRIGLSGTPVDGRLEELHSIFEYLKPGLFESRARFLENHAIMDAFGGIKGYTGVQEVRNRIVPYYIRRLKEKVLQDLPAKLFKDVYVELKPKEWKVYRDLIRGAHEITEEDQAITRILRVRQFLDFPELLQLRNPSWKFDALSALLEELIDANHDKVLLFTQYKQALDLLFLNLRSKYNILQIHGDVSAQERVEIVKMFNNDKKWNILLGTDAMSTGLNIGGANDVIHYEDNFSPAIMQQRNDRAHRATTRHNVTIYRFITKNTIEEKVRKALGEKTDLNNRVLDENCTEFGVGPMKSLDLLQYL